MTRTMRPCLLLVLLPLLWPGPAGADEEEAADPRPVAVEPAVTYRDSAAVGVALEALAARAVARGVPASVESYGQSQGGRLLLALRVGSRVPRVLVHGGLGRRDAAASAACLDLARRVANGEGGADEVSWLLIPAPNPDALDAFLAGSAPTAGPGVDRDRDGRRGEDGPQDVDGDGLILSMRRERPGGSWGAKAEEGKEEGKRTSDPRLVEPLGPDARRARSYELFDEGLDDDGDGRVNEDPPDLDLERQMCGWWDEQGPWQGDGPFPGFAAEARALMDLSFRESGLVAWYGFAGTGNEVLRASEHGKVADLDDALYDRVAEALKDTTGLETKRASAVRGDAPPNPGSDLDWAAAHLGVPAFRIPVWRIGKEEGNAREREHADELDWLLWNDRVLEGRGFAPWTPFDHPTLGLVEIGGWKPYSRHEPPAALLAQAVLAVSAAPLAHTAFVPRLALDRRVEDRGGGLYEVRVRVLATGEAPTDTEAAAGRRLSTGVRVRLAPGEGATVLAGPPVVDVGRLAAGQASDEVRWLLRHQGGGALGRVQASHPRAGEVEAEVTLP